MAAVGASRLRISSLRGKQLKREKGAPANGKRNQNTLLTSDAMMVGRKEWKGHNSLAGQIPYESMLHETDQTDC